LVHKVGRQNLLQSNRILSSAYTTSRDKYSTTPTQGVYLLRHGLSDLQLLGHALACHVARPPRWCR
jgi:hypothetical protein